jgi:hypothetical protein
MENTETRVWLDFSLALKFIDQECYDDLDSKAAEVGKLLNHMIENPENTPERRNESRINVCQFFVVNFFELTIAFCQLSIFRR